MVHAVPHAPQLALSVVTSTQADMPPDAQARPGAGHELRHAPATQLSPAPQDIPHIPQLPRSPIVSTHAAPQRVCPVGHAAGEHAPSVQRSPAAHAWPQPPQWAGAMLVSTHIPPQSICPVVHVAAAWQVPAEQVCAAEHAWPQAPQLVVSLVVSTQAPPQSVCPPGQRARHTEAVQSSVAPQARSHEPQWKRSLARLKHSLPQRA